MLLSGKGVVTNYREGRGLQNGSGGHVKSYPYEKGGGGEKVLTMPKGGGGEGAQNVLGYFIIA